MRTVAADALLARIRKRCEVSLQYLDDPALLDSANLVATELQDVLIECDPDRNCSSYLIDVVSGTQEYDLPPDLYGLRRVEVLGSDGKWDRIKPLAFDEMLDYQDATSSRDACRYTLLGETIHLSPPPGWSQTGGLRLWYWPVAAMMQLGVLPATPTTPSTQATGAAGITALRCNVPAFTVQVNGQDQSFPAQVDRLLHSGSVYAGVDGSTLTVGKSAIVSLVAKSSSAIVGQGVISIVDCKGPTALTGAQVPCTAAQIQAVVGAGLPWVEVGRATVDRTADLVLAQSFAQVATKLDGVNGWDEFIVNGVCSTVAIAQEEDPAPFLALQGKQEARIRRRARVRDLAEPKVMRGSQRGTVRRRDRLPRPA